MKDTPQRPTITRPVESIGRGHLLQDITATEQFNLGINLFLCNRGSSGDQLRCRFRSHEWVEAFPIHQYCHAGCIYRSN
jgi:hypothetical protein